MFFGGSKPVDQALTVHWLCQCKVSMPLSPSAPRNPFLSLFLSLRGIQCKYQHMQAENKAGQLGTPNGFISVQKKRAGGFGHDQQLLLPDREQDLQHPRFSSEMSLLAYQQADALWSVKLD